MMHSGGLETWLRDGVLQYRAMSGIVDMYVFSGGGSENKPDDVIQQYTDLVGKPYMIPYWSLGFHLLRWGYKDDVGMNEMIYKMRDENIPLETVWADIEWVPVL